ncbi:MAG TPA: response regulator transcription factor [Magnetospirillum sp.]|nr:response regulator transcription factor [Magnetospirillum sp.]
MRILLADDHPFYLDALERQLCKTFRGAEVQSFSSFEGLCTALGETSADLVILDFSMSDMNGTQAVRRVVSLAGSASVIVVSGVADTADVRGCIAAGARGYLPKTMDPRPFTDAVSVVLHGGTYLPIEYSAACAPVSAPAAVPPLEKEIPADISALDDRDGELLRMIMDGLTNKEIGRRMNLQEATVKFYVSRLFRRLGVKNRSQAAAWASRDGGLA